MANRITVIDGHPDGDGARFCHALASAYEAGAKEGGHDVRRIDVAGLEFPLIRTAADFEESEPIAAVRDAQEDVRWANHLVLIYPLWLGTLPALFKGFLEQVFRPGFGFAAESRGWPKKLLSGRSARIVVTMGMPAFVFRWYFRAHSLKSLERNILKFVGIGPIRVSLFGMVEAVSDDKRQEWLDRVKALGRAGE